MSKLFTDKYGIECTWTGRGKNISTKIGDSDLIKIMKSNFINTFYLYLKIILIYVLSTLCILYTNHFGSKMFPNYEL
jgi:hypothetical protein